MRRHMAFCNWSIESLGMNEISQILDRRQNYFTDMAMHKYASDSMLLPYQLEYLCDVHGVGP